MKLEFAARVEIGPKETNDDRVLVSGQVLDMCSTEGSVDTPTVMAVCDGCGGYAGGGIAAQTVLEFLSFEVPEALSDGKYLADVLANCEQMVIEKKRELPQYNAMCTTIAGCVFGEDGTVVFHSGDSRVYRYDQWGLARMTRDHSVVQEMVDLGEITPEEALEHPRRNVISRCIGVGAPAPELYVSHVPICAGETYVFCSDGLWESVRDVQIKEILDSEMSLPQKVDLLIEKALAQGADDNISVCICSAEGAVDTVEEQPFILD